MTTFSDNELIDKVLKASYDSPRQYIEVLYALEKITGIKDTPGPSEVYNLTKKISKKIISEGIADCKDDREVAIMINQKGIDIVDNGGYLQHIERLRNQALIESKIETAKTKKVFNDLTLSKWQKITFWPVFIFGFIGGILGAISLLGQLGLLSLPNLGEASPNTLTKSDSVSVHLPVDSVKAHQ